MKLHQREGMGKIYYSSVSIKRKWLPINADNMKALVKEVPLYPNLWALLINAGGWFGTVRVKTRKTSEGQHGLLVLFMNCLTSLVSNLQDLQLSN